MIPYGGVAIDNVYGDVPCIGNSTGKTSVYTVFEGHEVMFHVSTRLPHSVVNEQQVFGFLWYLVDWLFLFIVCSNFVRDFRSVYVV